MSPLPAPAVLQQALRDYGALLLRGFGLTVRDFDQFALHPDDVFVTHPSTVNRGRETVTATTATVDNGTLPFPWHCELGYAPFPPGLVMFYGEQTAGPGGETWLTDGCAIFDELSSEARQFVETERVTYTYVRTTEALPVAFAGARTPEQVDAALSAIAAALPAEDALEWDWITDGVGVRFTTSMLTRTTWEGRSAFCNQVVFQVRRRGPMTMADGSPFPEEVVIEVERLAQDLAYPVRWRAGDLVLCDNSRVMHARGEVVDRTRRVLARVCYLSR